MTTLIYKAIAFLLTSLTRPVEMKLLHLVRAVKLYSAEVPSDCTYRA